MNALKRFFEIVTVFVSFALSGLFILEGFKHPEIMKYFIIGGLGWFLAGGYRLRIWLDMEEK